MLSFYENLRFYLLMLFLLAPQMGSAQDACIKALTEKTTTSSLTLTPDEQILIFNTLDKFERKFTDRVSFHKAELNNLVSDFYQELESRGPFKLGWAYWSSKTDARNLNIARELQTTLEGILKARGLQLEEGTLSRMRLVLQDHSALISKINFIATHLALNLMAYLSTSQFFFTGIFYLPKMGGKTFPSEEVDMVGYRYFDRLATYLMKTYYASVMAFAVLNPQAFDGMVNELNKVYESAQSYIEVKVAVHRTETAYRAVNERLETQIDERNRELAALLNQTQLHD